MDLQKIGEFGLIEKIRGLFSGFQPGLDAGIGDDCAVYRVDDKKYFVVTTDILSENIHFNISTTDFFQLGWKALAVNLSDCAAVGAVPLFFTVSIAVPKRITYGNLLKFYKGLKACSKKYAVLLAGGDTSASDKHFFISITLFGETKGYAPVLRRGAGKGDSIWISGECGLSALGLSALINKRKSRFIRYHLLPEPKAKEGVFLAEEGFASSMIDISDGLLQDIRHIIKSSGVGAVIDMEKIPVKKSFIKEAGMFGLNCNNLILTGGEDYQLLFTVPKEKEADFTDRAKAEYLCFYKIGMVTGEKGKIRLKQKGKNIPLPERSGYDHFKR